MIKIDVGESQIKGFFMIFAGVWRVSWMQDCFDYDCYYCVLQTVFPWKDSNEVKDLGTLDFDLTVVQY